MKVPRLSAGAKAAGAWNAANHELPVVAESARAPPFVAEVTHRSRVWGELPASRAPGAKVTCELRAVRAPSAGAEVTPHVGAESPHVGAEVTPCVGAESPHVGAESPHVGAESPHLNCATNGLPRQKRGKNHPRVSRCGRSRPVRARRAKLSIALRSARIARQCLSCASPLRGSAPLRREA